MKSQIQFPETFIPLSEIDDWIAKRPSTMRCTIKSVVNLAGTHPTGLILALDFRPSWDRGEPAVYVVRLDGEEEVRNYYRHELEFSPNGE